MPVTPYIPALEEALEDGIVAVLQPLKPDFEVTYFADTTFDFKTAFDKPRISVMVHSGKSGDLLDTNIALSEETVFVQFCIESKTRRGPGGIYDLKRECVNAVNGLKLANWERLIYADFKYSERSSTGIWIYNVLFTTKQVNQQTFDDNYPDLSLVIGP